MNGFLHYILLLINIHCLNKLPDLMPRTFIFERFLLSPSSINACHVLHERDTMDGDVSIHTLMDGDISHTHYGWCHFFKHFRTKDLIIYGTIVIFKSFYFVVICFSPPWSNISCHQRHLFMTINPTFLIFLPLHLCIIFNPDINN